MEACPAAVAGPHIRSSRGTGASGRPLPPLVFERTPGEAARPLPSRWRRREPERTALHAVVRGHLSDLLDVARRRSDSGTGYPAFVGHEFHRYLDCGVLAHGFARLRCPDCGFERLVAFSCKGRLCPSCWARRAADTAADLVDRVLPEARYRQWVLTFPWAMRYLLATDRAFQSAVLRTFLRTVGAWMRLRARRLGLRRGQVGTVTFVQRFGGILNLNPHFHTLIPDGVFIEDADVPGGPLAFAALPPPTDAEIAALGLRLGTRIGDLARQRFRQTQDDPPWQDPDELPLRLTVAEAVRPPGPKPPRALPWEAAPPPDDQGAGTTAAKALCTRVQGFSLHAARTVAADDRLGLERLCRYGLRAPFSLDRLSLDPDGQVRYRLHRPWPTPDGRTEIVLEPFAFLRRLAALLPAPYQNLVRYHGVFANRSRFRNRLPAPPVRSGEMEVTSAASMNTNAAPAAATASSAPDAAPHATATAPAGPPPERPRRVRLGWAQLLRRVLDIDVLQCPRCPTHRPLVVLAFLTDPAVVRRILEHLKLPATPMPVAQARRIDWESECGAGQQPAAWDGCDADWGPHSAGDDVGIHAPARGPP